MLKTLTTALQAAALMETAMVMGSKVMVDNATVVKTDIVASNGVIHVIDSVIMPPKGMWLSR